MTTSQPIQPAPELSRRTFIQGSSVAVAGALAAHAACRASTPHRIEKDPGVKIGVIGCGGRGTGAVLNAVGAAVKSIYPEEGYHTEDVAEGATIAHNDIQVLALADLFEERLNDVPPQPRAASAIDVPKDQCFIGFDAYQKASRQSRNQLRHPGHASPFSASSTSRPRSKPARTSSWRSRPPSTSPA